MKSEPEDYSIDDLQKDKTTPWDGIRNYQARNIMRDYMRVGDKVLFYHSNAKPPGVAGIAQICSGTHPDETAFDKKSKYFDKKSKKEDPRWVCVDVKFVKKFDRFVPLGELKVAEGLEDMLVTQRGTRLSIQPLTEREFNTILKLGQS